MHSIYRASVVEIRLPSMSLADFFRSPHSAPKPGELSIGDALLKLADGGTLIDVRSREDYEAGHMPGARLASLQDLQDDPISAIWGDDPLAETDKPVIVVSMTPAHAAAVAHLLRDKGFDAASIAGGFVAWRAAGQPLIPGPPR